MRVLKLKFSQEIINNGEKCGWLKQMRAADEKHVSNKWWPNLHDGYYTFWQRGSKWLVIMDILENSTAS